MIEEEALLGSVSVVSSLTHGNVALADKYWKSEVAGSNSAWQGMWRRVDRVPHYRSRDELARAVAEAKAKPG